MQDPFDMSSFENGLTAPSPHPRYHTSPGQLETSSDDILGLLAQPVESFQKPATPPQKTVPRKSTPVEVESSDDEDSPRDRAIAAIVEMGFSIGQAARALSQTPSGLDVQLALENLLSRPSSAASSRARNATPDPARRGPAPPPQKDLSHIAGEVGTSLWKGAGSLWKTGREKVNTLIQEYQTPDAVEPGVPKWMREQQRYTGGRVEGGVSGTEEARKLEGGSRARDRIALAKQVEQEAEMGYRSSARRKVPSRTATPQERPPSRTAMPPVNPPEGDLFPPAPPRPSRTTTPQISKPTTPKPQRIIPPVSDAALATSNAARQRGSEAFKLGDYTSALTHYTTALTPLPATHPARTILLSNRAITNLKLGDAKAAVADCDALLAIVGEGRGEGEMVQDGEGEKSLKEIWGRGIVRRASGLEMLEKWDGALEMWRVAVNAGVGGTLALDGKKRCEAALGIAPAPVAAAGIPRSRSTPIPRTSTPRVGTPRSNTPRPKPAVAKGPSASESLAQYNATAAAEEDEKLRLYDAVEAKVTAWQGGKESNLRALLSSLDSILWAETGWKKVNMAELVVPNRVKIVYMKAIAKVHPDKVPPPLYPFSLYLVISLVLGWWLIGDCDGGDGGAEDDCCGCVCQVEWCVGCFQGAKWALSGEVNVVLGA